MTVTEPTLVHVLHHRASADPDHLVHLFGEDGEIWPSTLTLAELDERARAAAVGLQARTAPGDRVLLMFAPGTDFMIAFWACLYAGLIAVPVAPPSLRRLEASMERLQAIAANCSASLLLTGSDLRERLLPVAAALSTGTPVDVVAVDTLPQDAGDWTMPPITAGSVAYLQYSSGSTGLPKGVTLPHSAVLANAGVIGRAARLDTYRSGVCWLPTFHDMGLLSAVILPVVYGFTLYQLPPTTFVKRPVTWLRAMAQTRAGLTVAPTFAYDLCVRRIGREQAAELDLSAWRLALCGAEPIRAGILHAFAEHFAVGGFRREALFPCYGLAEATLMVSGGPLDGGMKTLSVDADALGRGEVRTGPAADARELVASGLVRPELPIVVADPDSLTPLPDGVVGELLVRGDSVARGYWNQPEATRETFDLAVPGAGSGFLRTGDLGFVHSGQVYVTGRRKDLLIVDGTNHYPQDVEAAAADACPELCRGGIAAFQTGLPGERSRLVVVAEVEPGARLVEEPDGARDGEAVGRLRRTLRAAVQQALAAPVDEVVLVRRGTIPFTTSGKLQRYAVAELYRAGALEEHLAPVAAPVVPTGEAVPAG